MKPVLTLAVSGILFASVLAAAPANAIPRTFVSGTGTSTACTRAAPCATFQAAHNVTDDGGEIDCLDAGDFGATLTITKNITIDCSGKAAGVFASVAGIGLDAITVNAPGATVRLRYLALHGGGHGKAGIRFISGRALIVENCVIADFSGGNVGDGIGIKFAPSGSDIALLVVKDSLITTNGRAADGGGIVIQPAGSPDVRVEVEHTRIENNTFGVLANGTGSTGTISVQIRDSVAAANVNDGMSALTAGGAAVTSMTLERSSSVMNGASGVVAQGVNAFVLLADSTVMSNQRGLDAVGGGNIFSYQDNQLTGNATDGAPTAALAVK